MSDLTIDVVGDWLGGTADLDDATFGALLVRAGGIALTEVQDSIAQTTREAIRVPAIRVARWLLTEWWRLRWEARPERVTPSWRRAHSMAALGGGLAWPALDVASDGEFVQLRIKGEHERDASAIRYLHDATVEVAAADWERAVDHFLDKIEGRVSGVRPQDRELIELREELWAERCDPTTAVRYRREARAGYEPGDAPGGWGDRVARLAAEAGDEAIDDVLAVSGADPAAAVETLKRARTQVDLSALAGGEAPRDGRMPWMRGADAARRVRATLGLPAGPVSDERLSELLGQRLPLPVDAAGLGPVLGGYRARDAAGVTRVLVGNGWVTTQRFYLARLFGMAAQLPSSTQVLPLTTSHTASQKFGRSFAQEFLCPWGELDAFTDEHGTGESALLRAAELYRVDERVITTTLVNKGKIERDRLATITA